jgi:Peptidase propeptide and YPEB domain
MADRLTTVLRRARRSFLLGLIGAATLAWAAQADDEAGPEDRARIAEALRAAGYQSFEEVELDDGVWEVDDAVGGDGRQYDLRLDRETLEIIDKEGD